MYPDTQSSPSDHMTGAGGDFEIVVEKPSEVIALLQRLIDTRALVNILAKDGAVLTTMLWWVDPAEQKIAFSVDEKQAGLEAIVGVGESSAVTYVDNQKLQFPLTSMEVLRGSQGLALQCQLPASVIRFQRRRFFRAQVPQFSTISLRFRMPQDPDQVIVGRVTDLSIDGCGLVLPPGSPALEPGFVIPSCRVDIDPEERFVAGFEVRRVQPYSDAQTGLTGTFLGCRWSRLDGSAERLLQLYVNRQQKLQRLMAKGRR
jgi:c-di-GMP-binding flagellar brake protein YcgR